MNKAIRILKNWTLPLGMSCGLLGFLAFHYIKALSPIKPATQATAEFLMPTVLFIMLFATFCKVNPRDMRITGCARMACIVPISGMYMHCAIAAF